VDEIKRDRKEGINKVLQNQNTSLDEFVLQIIPSGAKL
jgi:hypothetical protein